MRRRRTVYCGAKLGVRQVGPGPLFSCEEQIMPALSADRVRDVADPLVRARRCDLYDVEVLGRGPTQVVRVSIDRSGGVDTDTLATVNKMLSRALDAASVYDGRYTL